MDHTDTREVCLLVVQSPLILSQSPSCTFSGPDSHFQSPWPQQAEWGGVGLLAYNLEKGEEQGRPVPWADR